VSFRNTWLIMTSNAGRREISRDARSAQTFTGIMTGGDTVAALRSSSASSTPVLNRVDENRRVPRLTGRRWNLLKSRAPSRGFGWPSGTLRRSEAAARALLVEKGWDPSTVPGRAARGTARAGRPPASSSWSVVPSGTGLRRGRPRRRITLNPSSPSLRAVRRARPRRLRRGGERRPPAASTSELVGRSALTKAPSRARWRRPDIGTEDFHVRLPSPEPTVSTTSPLPRWGGRLTIAEHVTESKVFDSSTGSSSEPVTSPDPNVLVGPGSQRDPDFIKHYEFRESRVDHEAGSRSHISSGARTFGKGCRSTARLYLLHDVEQRIT
jgi:hypothetical protein